MTTTRPGAQPDEAQSPTRDLYRAAFAAPADGEQSKPRRGPSRAPARQSAAAATGLLLLVGVWLIAAPFLLDYVEVGGIDGSWNSVVTGAAVVLLALLGLSRVVRPLELSALVAVLGGWLLLAQHVLGYSAEAPRASVNETTCGIVVILLAVAVLGFALAARTSSGATSEPMADRASGETRAA
jgi:uncharacterized membrane protein